MSGMLKAIKEVPEKVVPYLDKTTKEYYAKLDALGIPTYKYTYCHLAILQATFRAIKPAEVTKYDGEQNARAKLVHDAASLFESWNVTPGLKYKGLLPVPRESSSAQTPALSA